jgi:sulfur dioxygenase
MGTTAAALVKAAKASVTEVSVTNAKDLVGQGVVFVDVREPSEWQAGTISDALRIPRGVLEWRAEEDAPLKDKSTPIVVYCKSGGRSALAAQTLGQLGFDNVQSLAGGYEAWIAKSA